VSSSPAAGPRVGRPAPALLVAGYFAAALACWLAAAAALLAARDELAAGAVWTPPVLLALHLAAVGFLPLAVTGGALHILPTLLRANLAPRRAGAALPLLCAGPALAYAIAYDRESLLWPCATAEAAGFLLVWWELTVLVARAPRGRLLLASRLGVALSSLHAGAALAAGALLAARADRPLWGIPHERLIGLHLHLAVLGWLTLLLVTVGRTLGPMLALAPAAPPRRAPVSEIALSLALWLLLAGLAAGSRPLELAGALGLLLVLGHFAALLVRVSREHRLEAPEGPLLHVLAGLVFVVQAAVLGVGMLLGLAVTPRRLAAYVLALLVGWAAGVTVGHLGKLLSLSVWAWWPPGPRPKQAALYPARLWLAEAALFVAGIEVAVDGILAGSAAVIGVGGVLLAAAAAAASGAALRTVRAGRPALRLPVRAAPARAAVRSGSRRA